MATVDSACSSDQGPAPVVGRQAPDFRLASLDGGQIGLSDYLGKPVILNFMATWCAPCRFELPTFQAAAERNRSTGLIVLLVDLQEDADDVGLFLGGLNIKLPTVLDRSGEISRAYRVRGLPSTFFIGRDGVIRVAQLGVVDERLLESGISKIV